MFFKLLLSVVLSYILYKLFFAKRKVIYSLNTARMHKQSRQLESGTFVNSAYVDSGKEFDNFTKDCKTLYDAFQRGLRIAPSAPCMGYKGPFTPYKVTSLYYNTNTLLYITFIITLFLTFILYYSG